MLDILWVKWTLWAHQGVWCDAANVIIEWELRVRDTILRLWVRALRRNHERTMHVDHIPGSKWQKDKVDWVSQFIKTWRGDICDILAGKVQVLLGGRNASTINWM